MAEDSIKDSSILSVNAGTKPTSSSDINSAPTTSVNSAVDDKENKSTSSGLDSTPSTQVQASSTNVDVKASISSSNVSSGAPVSTVEVNATKPEVKYSIKDLIENSKILTGHKREVAVGAVLNCKEKELTKKDFKDLIDKFLKRKVK